VSLSESQRTALVAVCDTFFPSLAVVNDPDGFWARSASDLGVPAEVERYLEGRVEPVAREGLKQLLDVFAAQDFPARSQEEREQMLAGFAAFGPEVVAGIDALRSLALLHAYGVVDASGQNPNWKVLGYPGPQPGGPPAVPKPIACLEPEGSSVELEADVCVVGSGAGGGVIAGVLAQAGRRVLVLELGGYYNESDYNQQELWAYEHLYYKGGIPPTSDGNVSLLCGQNLGGGTTVNWMTCFPTRESVRREWASDHGLTGVDGPEFDAHLAAVLERIKANEECSDLNGPHQRMREGCAALGWSFKPILRNSDPDTYDPVSAGYVHFGDRSGSRQGTQKTFLLDAAGAGARFLVGCRAERVLVAGGRAAGVAARWTGPDGRSATVTVRCPQVVVACGALESPALLLRSGIGGPAAGRNLKLHPGGAVSAFYPADQHAWWGPPQAAYSDQFADRGDGFGFLVEAPAYGAGLGAAVAPWESGAAHKALMARGARSAGLVYFVRDRGSGSISIDAAGNSVSAYALTDPVDIANLRAAREACVRIHAAAGAEEITAGHRGGFLRWTRGSDDLETFLAAMEAVPAEQLPLFSAHQMGSCRMGTDPATSVAGVWGELHDTPGVWIGDGSAFPSAPGTNPMVSIMALARRTAEAMLGTT
jgi:choline dehydrogenase-like flavoprotein